MDAITQAFSSLNSSGALKDVGQVAGIGSTAYNMYNQYQNQQYQDQLRSYAQDPTKMNAYAAQFTQPLNAGLTTSVANNTQAYLAQHGLTDSPEIAQTVQAQAIAPYIQQNQQAGYQDALQALQVGGGAVNPNNNSANSISALAKMFAGGGGTTAPGGLQALQNYLRTMGTQAPQLSGVGAPSGPAPGPVDTSGWDSGAPDMSSFYQQDYSAGGGDSAPYLGSD